MSPAEDTTYLGRAVVLLLYVVGHYLQLRHVDITSGAARTSSEKILAIRRKLPDASLGTGALPEPDATSARRQTRPLTKSARPSARVGWGGIGERRRDGGTKRCN
jgi:hypothetical protein